MLFYTSPPPFPPHPPTTHTKFWIILYSACPSIRSISLKRIDGISLCFADALTLTISTLLLNVNFCRFTTWLWLLVIVKISFPFNTFWTNWWNLNKFCICMDLNQMLEFLHVIFCKFTTVMTLVCLFIVSFSFPLNFWIHRWNLNSHLLKRDLLVFCIGNYPSRLIYDNLKKS